MKKSVWFPSFCDYDEMAHFADDWLKIDSDLASDSNGDVKVDFIDCCPAVWCF